MPNTLDTMTLQMALIGYEAERQKIQDKIAVIQRQLNGRTRRVGTPATATTSATRSRRRMSATARRRIAAAQKKRWAEYRKRQKAA